MWVDLPDDVRDELLNLEFASRSHYSRATYALGCHGPLCRLAETHRGRRRNELKALAAEREFTPGERDTSRESELLAIIEWHRSEREKAVPA